MSLSGQGTEMGVPLLCKSGTPQPDNFDNSFEITQESKEEQRIDRRAENIYRLYIKMLRNVAFIFFLCVVISLVKIIFMWVVMRDDIISEFRDFYGYQNKFWIFFSLTFISEWAINTDAYTSFIVIYIIAKNVIFYLGISFAFVVLENGLSKVLKEKENAEISMFSLK